MGELVVLGQREEGSARRRRPRAKRRSPRAAGASAPPPGAIQFIYDLSCPLSYLAAEQVEQSLGEVQWIPAITRGVRREAVRAEATRRARALRLPLAWPDRYPQPILGASRAAAHAAAAGFGARFGLAALRLAFCGGYDLEDPAILSEAAAAAGISVHECLEAAGDPRLDCYIYGTATSSHPGGLDELPAVRIGRGALAGMQAVTQAAARLAASAGTLGPSAQLRLLAPPA